ncbi:hypothetical protein ACFLU6_16485, partial [Acidobacteriota bacterium]
MRNPGPEKYRVLGMILLPMLIIVLHMVLYYRVVLLGESLYYRDVASFHYPMKHTAVSQLKDGQLPLWNSQHAGGQPLLANPNYSVLSPLNIPFLVLPPQTAFSLSEVMAFIVSSLGIWFLCRYLGFHRAASFLAALFFTFSGPVCSL